MGHLMSGLLGVFFVVGGGLFLIGLGWLITQTTQYPNSST